MDNLNPNLLKVVNAICASTIEIEKCIRHNALQNLNGDHGSQNSSGDVQKKLDVISNDIMIKHLVESRNCNILLSEENEEPIIVPDDKKGDYLVTFDPLDGSSNIDCNCCIGTIFSIYENKNQEILKNGNDMLMAGYVLYGPSTELVIATNKVDRFVLGPNSTFVHIGTIKFEKGKKIYSINESNSYHWFPDIQKYIDDYKKNKYTSRYIGSMVADVHRTLLYGGMFCYPADRNNPNGKLRLLYECYPMAKIFECAGGKAIVGNMSTRRILDVKATHIHQRTPILLGSTEEIEKYEIKSKI